MLKTERLIIRTVRLSDAPGLFKAFGDVQAMRYWSSAADTNLQDTILRVEELVGLEEPVTYFVIEHNGQAIGTVGIHTGDEIGFMLDRAYWRKGIMTEALGALIPWLFQTLDITQITADADPRNEASVGLLKSLGFNVTGEAENTFCVSGEWSDSIYLALQRPS